MNGADPTVVPDPSPQSSPTLRGGSVETLPPPRPRRRKRLPAAVLLAGGIALLGLGSALAALVIRVVAPPVGLAPAAPISTGSVAARVDPSAASLAPSASVAQPSAVVSATPPPTATAHHLSRGGTPAHFHPHPTARPKGGTGSGPNLDIQRER